MEKTRKIGIWMDCSRAYVMEFNTRPFEIHTIVNEFRVQELLESKTNHDSRLKGIYKYYNHIAEAIVKYNKIILFGPAKTKIDFFDVLSEDYRFSKMKVKIKESDKMNLNQQYCLIRKYFSQQ